jgi:hypothetical protein
MTLERQEGSKSRPGVVADLLRQDIAKYLMGPRVNNGGLDVIGYLSESMQPVDLTAELMSNNPQPADLYRGPAEHVARARYIAELLEQHAPDDLSESALHMVVVDALSSTFKMGLENKASYDRVEDVDRTLELELVLMKYARGLANGTEALKLMVGLDMDNVGLIDRDHPFQEPPEDLIDAIHALFETVATLVEPSDQMGLGGDRTRIKQLDVPIGSVGLDGIILSRKTNLATIDDGRFVICERKKLVVNVRRMPERWRLELREAVARVRIDDLGGKSEQVVRDRLFDILLSTPDPDDMSENPATLRSVSEASPFIDVLKTSMYGFRLDESYIKAVQRLRAEHKHHVQLFKHPRVVDILAALEEANKATGEFNTETHDY